MKVRELIEQLKLYDLDDDVKISLIVDTNKLDPDESKVGCIDGIYFVDANVIDMGASDEPTIFAEDVNYDGICCDKNNCHCMEC